MKLFPEGSGRGRSQVCVWGGGQEEDPEQIMKAPPLKSVCVLIGD